MSDINNMNTRDLLIELDKLGTREYEITNELLVINRKRYAIMQLLKYKIKSTRYRLCDIDTEGINDIK